MGNNENSIHIVCRCSSLEPNRYKNKVFWRLRRNTLLNTRLIAPCLEKSLLDSLIDIIMMDILVKVKDLQYIKINGKREPVRRNDFCADMYLTWGKQI